MRQNSSKTYLKISTAMVLLSISVPYASATSVLSDEVTQGSNLSHPCVVSEIGNSKPEDVDQVSIQIKNDVNPEVAKNSKGSWMLWWQTPKGIEPEVLDQKKSEPDVAKQIKNSPTALVSIEKVVLQLSIQRPNMVGTAPPQYLMLYRFVDYYLQRNNIKMKK